MYNVRVILCKSSKASSITQQMQKKKKTQEIYSIK